MPDPVAGMFRGPWQLRSATGPGVDLLLLHVITCHAAWRALTQASRTALLDLAEDETAPVHAATRRCLTRHGLADTAGLTAAGREVVRHRPTSPVVDEEAS